MDVPPNDGSEAFVTYGRGHLKVFNSAKNFGFISPVFKGQDTEGPPLPASCEEGLWFFGNHSLPFRAVPGLELTFEIWENSQGKAQARSVRVSAEPTQPAPDQREALSNYGDHRGGGRYNQQQRLHPNEPRTIYPSVYVSDVPVEWNEGAIKKLHRQLGLNPDTIMGLKFLPFTEVSLGIGGDKSSRQATPVTGAVILRYLNEEAANAGVERLKGHPIQTSTGVTKHLGAKHATPPKWVVQRKQQADSEPKPITNFNKGAGEAIKQKVTGVVARVSMSGYGCIKSPEWGEVMWRQYELPTNLRCLQFSHKAKFAAEVQGRDEYLRLKDMEGKEVEAELYRLPDGQLRASHVRVQMHGMIGGPASGPTPLPPAYPGAPPAYEPEGMPERRFDESGPSKGGPMGVPGGMPPPGMPGMPPPGMPGMPPGMPPFMDPKAYMEMMQAQMGKKEKKEKKKDKKDKDKKDKKKKKRDDSSGSAREEDRPKKRRIDDEDF